MGKYEEALDLCERSLELTKKALGFEHPSVVTSLNNLAELYCHTGKYEKAILLYEQSLEVYEKTLGVEHPSYAATLNNLTTLLLQQG